MQKTFLQKLIQLDNFNLVKKIIYHVESIEKEDIYSLVKLCVTHNDITFLKFIEEKADGIKKDILDVIFFYSHIFNNDAMEYLLENYINDMNQKEIDRLFRNLSEYVKDIHILEFFVESYHNQIPQQTLDDALYDTIAKNRCNIDVIKYLINLGANINYEVNGMEQRGEQTCLLNAISNGNLEVVRFLLQNGADVFYNEHDAIELAYNCANAFYNEHEAIELACNRQDFEILQTVMSYDKTTEDYFFKRNFSDIDNKLFENYVKKRL